MAKIIEANDDYAYGLTSKKVMYKVPEGAKSVTSIMQEYLKILQDLSK